MKPMFFFATLWWAIFNPAFADEGSGKIVLSIGSVAHYGSGGETLSEEVGTSVAAGNTLVTGDGIVHVKFNDGGLIALQPFSTFEIEKYRFQGSEDGEEWALFKLLKGGLRAISGAIGHARQERYRLQTEYATIGIRGTAYNVLVCQSICADVNGESYAAGLHVETTEGLIFVENVAGVLDVPVGQSAYVRDNFAIPQFVPFHPNFVRHEIQQRERLANADEGASDSQTANDTNALTSSAPTEAAAVSEGHTEAGAQAHRQAEQKLAPALVAGVAQQRIETAVVQRITTNVAGDVVLPEIKGDMALQIATVNQNLANLALDLPEVTPSTLANNIVADRVSERLTGSGLEAAQTASLATRNLASFQVQENLRAQLVDIKTRQLQAIQQATTATIQRSLVDQRQQVILQTVTGSAAQTLTNGAALVR